MKDDTEACLEPVADVRGIEEAEGGRGEWAVPGGVAAAETETAMAGILAGTRIRGSLPFARVETGKIIDGKIIARKGNYRTRVLNVTAW